MDTEAVDYDEEPAPPVEAVKNSGGRQSKGRGHVMKSPDESDRGGTYDRIEFSESRTGAGVKCIISIYLAIQINYFILIYHIYHLFFKNIN
jgi:hypothetical protein